MPHIPVGFAQVSLIFQFDGDSEDMLCTFGVEVSGTVDEGTLTDIATAFQDRFEVDLASELNLVGAKAAIGQDGDPITVEVGGLGLNFTGGTSLPPNCAMLIRKITGLGGRHNRGRMYVPGVRAASVTPAGIFGSGALEDLQTDATAFLADVVTLAEIEAVDVLHVRRTLDPTTVTNFIVDGRLATQRRRLRP